jgi:hypothetical protein
LSKNRYTIVPKKEGVGNIKLYQFGVLKGVITVEILPTDVILSVEKNIFYTYKGKSYNTIIENGTPPYSLDFS